MSDTTNLSPVEGIKTRSRGLRGSLKSSLENQVTGQLHAPDQQLVKFHGIYQQDDRDRREEREEKKLEPAYSYMIRLRLPGGDLTAEHWLGLSEATDTNASGTIKITTRQTIQVHGVVKSKLKPTMQWFDRFGLDAIAACGDINRNVMAGAHPSISPFQEEVHAFADKISTGLLPKSNAYAEIWLDGEQLNPEAPAEEDPLYQDRYLPRKFKVAVAIPPHNETDVFAHDVGFIAIEEDGKLAGFNVSIGGGMGMTHGNPETYPRLGSIIGFVTPDKVVETTWQVAAVQRDHGNRADRKNARLKYTIDRMGLDVFKAEVEKRLGFSFAPAREFKFDSRADLYGWREDHLGRWHYTLFVENGRVMDMPDYPVKTTLLEIAKSGLAPHFRFTANQNVMLINVSTENKAKLQTLLETHGIAQEQAKLAPVETHALACVALSTCPLALAEAQRYLPSLLKKIETLLSSHGLGQTPISIRMTGCPNGCARPYVAEIGFVGKSLGHYNFYIGGDALGMRLNTLYKEDLNEEAILATLNDMFAAYAKERNDGETFGDFSHRRYIQKAA